MSYIKRLIKSFIYAFRGLEKSFREEQNLKIQTAVGFVVIFISAYLDISITEWTMLIFAISLVIIMELANSAIERVTDVLKPRINGYVKEIKDIMAAAVMVASLTAVIIGILILGPHILAFF